MKANVIVSLYGREVGRLLWDAHKGNMYFLFSEEYKANGLNIAPLVAPLDGIAASLPIWGERDKYQNLPPFLADSLPDSWGSQLFDVWRAQQKIPRSAVTPLEKLSFIGRRGMGALEKATFTS